MRKRSAGKPVIRASAFLRSLVPWVGALTSKESLAASYDGHAGFRLHGIAGNALRAKLDANLVSRARHGLLGGLLIAVFVFERQIVGHVVMNAHGSRGARILGFDQHRQILVLHRDAFGGVLREVLGLGDDDRDRLADKADAIVRQPVARRHVQRGAADAFEESHRRQAFPAGGGEVGAGHDPDDAGHGARRVGVDLHDLRVRPIAAHEISRRLPVDGDIGGVAAMAGDEAGVLTPAVELMFGHNPSPTYALQHFDA